jgi:hypothetical protein
MERRADHGLELRTTADVRCDRQRFAALAGDLRNDRLREVRRVEMVDDDPGAGLAKGKCDRLTDAGGRARDDRDLPVKPATHSNQ